MDAGLELLEYRVLSCVGCWPNKRVTHCYAKICQEEGQRIEHESA